MSVFKNLERSDVYLSDFDAHRSWKISGSQLVDLGIRLIRAYSGSLPYLDQKEDYLTSVPLTASKEANYITGSYNSRLYYESLKHTYYSGSLGDGTFSGSLDLYPQTTLTVSRSRKLPSDSYTDEFPPGLVLFSLPSNVVGSGIVPGSFLIENEEEKLNYINPQDAPPQSHYIDADYYEDLSVGNTYDYEGCLVFSGFIGTYSKKEGDKYPSPDRVVNETVGDIIYSHGQVMFTNTFVQWLYANWDCRGMGWKSKKPVFTENIVCSVRSNEFNYTFNPTVSTGSGTVAPYISSIGFYDSIGNLLAVAKLSKPVKKSDSVDMTFVTKIDLG